MIDNPEVVRLASQVQLESLSAAVNAAVARDISCRKVIVVDGRELIFPHQKRASSQRYIMVFARRIKMLKVIGKSPVETIEIICDEYVPFKMSCSRERKSPSFYWRSGNFVSSLVEIEVAADDGVIVGLSLLLPGNLNLGIPHMICPEKSCAGMPSVDVNLWPVDRIIDEMHDISVFIERSKMLIRFENIDAEKVISPGQVSFGINAELGLSWILVNDFDASGISERF